MTENPTKEYINQFIDKLDVNRKYPVMLMLNVTNVCNFACPHCPQPEMAARADYKGTFFDYDAYTRIIDEIADKDTKFIRFTGDGEPLLHKRFIDMVAYAKSKTAIPLVLTTNGSMLDEIKAVKLLDLGLDVIDVSLDAFTREKFDVVRTGGNYHQVMSNLHRFIYLRNMKKAKTKILVNMINQEIVAGEVDDFKKYWAPLVDFVLVRNLHSATNQVKLEEVHGNMQRKQPDRHPCAHLWKRLSVGFDLKAKFCAHEWYDETTLAKVGPGGIKEIWFGDRINEIRLAHTQNNFAKVPVCENCPDWAAAPWDYGFELIIEKLGLISLNN